MRNKDLTGKRFGRLVAKERVATDSNGYAVWRCICDCGNEKLVASRYLTGGGTTSCGCYAKEQWQKRITKHGRRHSRLYNVHRSMLQRCNNPNAHEYQNYGGRGIKVCDELTDFPTFEKWAFENGYNENAKRGECTLDRIDTNGDYSPSNCRFVGLKTQERNRRNTVKITYKGEEKALSEWAEITGVQHGTLYKRYVYGWTAEQIIEGK